MPATATPRLTRDQRIRAAQLARAVVTEVAPDRSAAIEEDLVDYVRDPDLVLRPPRARDRRGGFNLGDVDPTLAIFALPLADAAVRYLVGVAVEAVQLEARPRLVALLRRPLHRTPPAPDPVPLSTAQLDQVWEHVRGNALALTSDERAAELLANAVRGGLERSR